MPVNAGEYLASLTTACTNAVLATCVVFTADPAVGAVGMPVNAGEFSGALVVSVGCTWSCRAFKLELPTAAVPSIRGEETAKSLAPEVFLIHTHLPYVASH